MSPEDFPPVEETIGMLAAATPSKRRATARIDASSHAAFMTPSHYQDSWTPAASAD